MPYDREGNYTLELIDLSDDTTVAHAPTAITNTLQPPVGFVYEVVNIDYNAPAPVGDSAGTHKVTVEYDGTSLALINGNHSTTIKIYQAGFSGDVGEIPGIVDDQLRIMREWLVASYDNPIDFVYTNSTDADQTGTRVLRVWVKKYREAIL